MDTTKNYGLKKPGYDEGADIQALNENAEIIDAELKKADNHRTDIGNPHKVTAAQVGAPAKTTADLTYYVDASAGLDTNNGLTVSTPFKNIQYAISKIPQVVNHTIVINLAVGTYAEELVIRGFVGFGTLIIKGASNNVDAVNYKINTIYIDKCDVFVDIAGINCISDLDQQGAFNAGLCKRVSLDNCITTQVETSASRCGFYITEGSVVYLSSCVASNKVTGVYCRMSATVLMNGVSGTGNNYAKIADAGIIYEVANNTISGQMERGILYGGQIIGTDGKSTSSDGENLLINGNFEINQRALSSYGYGYTVDRWKNIFTDLNMSSVVTRGMSSGNGYITVTIASSSVADGNNLCQQLENSCDGYSALCGRTVTFSIEVATSALCEYRCIYIGYRTTTNGAFTFTTVVIPKNTVSVRFSVTKYIPIYAMDVQVGIGVTRAIISSDVGTSITIAKAKLEIGSVPTPFVPRPIVEELAMCQRYYEAHSNYMVLTHAGDTELRQTVQFRVKKRVVPTITILSANGTVGKIGKYNGTTWDDFAYDSTFTADTNCDKYAMFAKGIPGSAYFMWNMNADAEIY